MTLKGKVAVVTGGSRGIGRAIALEMAQLGADIAFTYLRNHSAARETAAQIEALGVHCLKQQSHMGDEEKIKRFFARVEETFGRLDILVNNAASGVQRPMAELESKHWDWTMNINVRAPWLCAKEAIRLMNRGGSIVNISSLGSQRVLPYYLSVGVSKGALETLTRYLAVELAPLGIQVNGIAGGYIKTDALRHFPNQKQMLELAQTKTPAKRMVTPEDVAQVVTFLCSPSAEMIRGQTLIVDGGSSLLP